MKFRPTFSSILIGLFLLLSVAACAQTAVVTPTPVTISIAGSTEMRPVLVELTGAYTERHPNVLFSLRGGGSILGETWLESRRADLAASTTFPDEEEGLTGLMRVPIGLDGVAVIVHKDNPVIDLTLSQLRDIYNGKILDWAEAGGQPGEIGLVSREDGSATRMLFEERVMGEERVALTAVVMPTSEDVVEYVAEHPQALGYVSRAYVMANPASPQGSVSVGVVALEGRLPTSEEIAAQSYYLTRPIFLLRRASNGAGIQPFIDFVLSPAGQEIVARYHVRIR